MVLAVGELVVKGEIEPTGGLDVGLHREVPPDSLGVVHDAASVGVGEGHAGVAVGSAVGHGDVGGVGPAGAEHVGGVEPADPRVCLHVIFAGRIPVEGGSDQGALVEAGTPVLVITPLHVVGAVGVLEFVSYSHEVLGRHGVHILVTVELTEELSCLTHGTATVLVLEFEVVVVALHGGGVAELDAGLAVLGAAGRDDDRAVATLGTVQSGSCGALQDVDVLDIIHVDGVLVRDGTIHDIDGLATTPGTVGLGTTKDDGS